MILIFRPKNSGDYIKKDCRSCMAFVILPSLLWTLEINLVLDFSYKSTIWPVILIRAGAANQHHSVCRPTLLLSEAARMGLVILFVSVFTFLEASLLSTPRLDLSLMRTDAFLANMGPLTLLAPLEISESSLLDWAAEFPVWACSCLWVLHSGSEPYTPSPRSLNFL
jgi:hypothetical protein